MVDLPGEGSGRELAERVDRRLYWISLLANFVGALVVLGFLVMLAPGFEESEIGRVAAINFPAFAVYLTAALVLGGRRGRRNFAPIDRWLREERPATPEERELVLRYPLSPVRIAAALWGLAAVFFPLINLAVSAELSLTTLVTVPLGGVASCAVTYLLVERIMRPVTARALAGDPPDRPAALGVTGRVAVAWVAGTGVPVLGLAAVALGNLLGSDLFGDDEVTLSGVAVLLSMVALGAGLIAVFLAARSVADPVTAVREAVQGVERGELDSRVAVDDGSEVGLLQAGFNRMAAGLEERERMRDLFGRHVGREVAAAALDSEVKLGGEEREVAALFVDLVGSTALATELPAHEIVSLLNEFFRVVVEVTEDHGGLVNKFQGDAALCVFGAPVESPDPAGDALAAAREMRDRLRGKDMPVDLGIGVSAGLAVAGNVGAEERFEYTVIGDPINESARLCELAKKRPERVLASERAVRRSRDPERHRWSLQDEVTLRGRSDETRLATPN